MIYYPYLGLVLHGNESNIHMAALAGRSALLCFAAGTKLPEDEQLSVPSSC
jgi:hypothetical protein